MLDHTTTIEQIEQMNGFKIVRIVSEHGFTVDRIRGIGRDTHVWSPYTKKDLQYMIFVNRTEDWLDLRDESQDEVIRFNSELVHLQSISKRETDETY